MNDHIIIIGSPAFLRFWSLLGCEEHTAEPSCVLEQLEKLASGNPSLVLYEENLTKNFTKRQKRQLQQFADPCWVPLPSAGGEKS